MSMCSFLVWKNACLNYCEFDLEGDLVGVPHTWYLSAQSFIRLLKLVWREYDIVAMNEWKKKCVGLQRTWVSKRTVGLSLDVLPNDDLTVIKSFVCSPFSKCDIPVLVQIINSCFTSCFKGFKLLSQISHKRMWPCCVCAAETRARHQRDAGLSVLPLQSAGQ